MSDPAHFWIRATSGGGLTTWRRVLVATDENQNYTIPGQLTLSKASGTAPMVISSTTRVDNLNADLLDGFHAGNANGNVAVSNGTLNTNLNADLLDSLHETAFCRPRGVIPAGDGNSIAYWTGVLPGIYSAGPGRVTGQPANYGLVIVEKDDPSSGEYQITWKEQSNGNIYRNAGNSVNISAWEIYVTTGNISSSAVMNSATELVRNSYYTNNKGVAVTNYFNEPTSFGALYSLLHGPLSGAYGAKMLVTGAVLWTEYYPGGSSSYVVTVRFAFRYSYEVESTCTEWGQMAEMPRLFSMRDRRKRVMLLSRSNRRTAIRLKMKRGKG